MSEVNEMEKDEMSGETQGDNAGTENREEALEQELAAQKDLHLRVLAEYDNYRKRSSKEKGEAYGDGVSQAVTEFLGVIDNFQRAVDAETSDENFKNGVTMIFNQYLAVLKKLGVEEIIAKDQPFNPNLHHAVSQVEDPELGENIIAEVFQKGYTLGERVIRPAMVVVANP